MSNFLKLIIIFAVVIGVGVASVFAWSMYSNVQDKQVVCTMEAKLCDDGSSVGRTGPKCEFTECPKTPAFGEVLHFTIGKKIIMTGLTVALKEINDSRCKTGVVCVWAGELSPVFMVTYGNELSQSVQITLGTTTAKKVTKNGYTFTLKEATESTADIIITKELKTAGMGNCYASGCSGEICSDRQDVVSECIYKEEYAQYKDATCERQPDGQCGWTQLK